VTISARDRVSRSASTAGAPAAPGTSGTISATVTGTGVVPTGMLSVPPRLTPSSSATRAAIATGTRPGLPKAVAISVRAAFSELTSWTSADMVSPPAPAVAAGLLNCPGEGGAEVAVQDDAPGTFRVTLTLVAATSSGGVAPATGRPAANTR